jgi:hypothetical protein
VEPVDGLHGGYPSNGSASERSQISTSRRPGRAASAGAVEHEKFVVIDRRLAFCGGINLSAGAGTRVGSSSPQERNLFHMVLFFASHTAIWVSKVGA